jgi:uracil-DNA glycosylase
MNFEPALPSDWHALIGDQLSEPYMVSLAEFLAAEGGQHEVFPPAEQVFRALELTPVENVRIVLLGQDPYHGHGQAHGLSFSVEPPTRPPPSLVNMFKERESDLGMPRPDHGDLSAWARRGVLLLNTVLTVRCSEPNSHRKRGWERFTDTLIARLSARANPLVFMLWGGPAKKKAKLIDQDRHRILSGTHPSPLSAHRGFLGSRPYTRANEALRELGLEEMDWSLP